MMEIEFISEEGPVWVDVSNSEQIAFWAMISDTTGAWRTGGSGKPFFTK